MLLNNTKNPGIKEAIKELKHLNAIEIVRENYEAKMKAKSDRLAEDAFVRDEGKREKMMELIRMKLQKGQSVEQIADALEDTPENIEKLIQNL